MTVVNQSIKYEFSMRFYITAITTFIMVCFVALMAWHLSLKDRIKTEPSQPIKSSTLETTVNTVDVKIESTQQESMSAEAVFREHRADVKDLQVWDRQHGYYSAAEMLPYEAYNDVTLEELCKNGDMLALTVSAGRFINQGDTEKANLYYWRSVVVGSTASLGNLANFVGPVFFNKESLEEQRRIRRASSIESLSIIKMAELRGDTSLKENHPGPLVAYEYHFGPISLTTDELQAINQRAQQLYDEAQAKRLEMGLGPFDNSTPKLQKILSP